MGKAHQLTFDNIPGSVSAMDLPGNGAWYWHFIGNIAAVLVPWLLCCSCHLQQHLRRTHQRHNRAAQSQAVPVVALQWAQRADAATVRCRGTDGAIMRQTRSRPTRAGCAAAVLQWCHAWKQQHPTEGSDAINTHQIPPAAPSAPRY
jgi:hypothetical protein